MTLARFQELCDAVCDASAVARFHLREDSDAPVAFHLLRQGIAVDAMYFPRTSPDHVFLFAGLGELPAEDARIGSIVLSLLEVNFQPSALHPPVIGRNPSTGEIVLKCVCPLLDITAPAFVASIDQCVFTALEWRKNFFQEESEEGVAWTA